MAKIATILERLQKNYPNATYELDWDTPEEMLVATILAAQCTDERVNRVTRTLFEKYPSPKAYAEADFDELAEDLKPTGFYRQKTKTVQTVCRALVSRFGGKVPRTMKELVSIKGIARKTANVVLNCCFDMPSGIIVDTHVARVSQRMGLSRQKNAEKIERDLMKQVPKPAWTFWGPANVLLGRYTCKAKEPECARCPMLDLCPRKGVHSPRPDPVPVAPPVPPVDTWVEKLADEIDKPYMLQLLDFVARERQQHEVFPGPDDVFSAFAHTPFDQVKVLILGQDPYHDVGQAHGLSFSVRPGIKTPPSLKNIYKELKSDLGIPAPDHGHLVKWAEQGVLMLNAVLTVRAHKPNSHKQKGWETFTDAVIRRVSADRDHVVFLLWGKYAQKKAQLIDKRKHTILQGHHPSPLSARRGFFGSRPFSAINKALQGAGQGPIDWRL